MDGFFREQCLSVLGKTVTADSFEREVSAPLQVVEVVAPQPTAVLIGYRITSFPRAGLLPKALLGIVATVFISVFRPPPPPGWLNLATARGILDA